MTKIETFTCDWCNLPMRRVDKSEVSVTTHGGMFGDIMRDSDVCTNCIDQLRLMKSQIWNHVGDRGNVGRNN